MKLNPYEPVAIGVAVNKTSEGMKVRWVEPDSPAAEAGIQTGDLIKKVRQRPGQKTS